MSENRVNFDRSFEERLRLLSEPDRSVFERCARIIEDRGATGERDCAALVGALEYPAGIRSLLLVHAGKVWIDLTRGDVGCILEAFPELRTESWAIEEMERWNSQWKPVPEPTPLNSQSATPLYPRRNPPSSDGKDGPATEHAAAQTDFKFPEYLKPIRSFERSGMGRVWLVFNLRTKREEVLKAANDSVLMDPELIARFRSEPAKTSRIKLDSIVTVYGCEESHGIPYFLMEYMNSGSLADKLSSGPIVAQQAVKYLAQLARTVGRVHERELVHHDIKPANILFTRNDDHRELMKLADFGLARTLPAKWKEGLSKSADVTDLMGHVPTRVVGTAGYIPPEAFDTRLWRDQAPSELEKGIQADVFALGVTLYTALTGRLPYQPIPIAGTPIERTPPIVNPLGPAIHDLVPPRQLNPSVDVELDALCQRALRKSPCNRFRDAHDLATALEHWLGQNALRAGATRATDMVNENSAQQTELQKVLPPVELQVPQAPTRSKSDSLKQEQPPRSAGVWQSAPQYRLQAAVALVAVFVLVVVFRDDKTDPVSDSVTATKPANVIDDGIAKAKPALSPVDPFAGELVANHWPRDAAIEVAKLNQSWFSCVKSSSFLEKQKFNLCRLGDSSLPLMSLRSMPHVASLLATVTTPDLQRNILRYVTTDTSSDNRPVLLNAYLRELADSRSESLTMFLQDRLPLGLELQHKGLVGAESMLLTTENGPVSATLSEWMTDILRMGDGSDLNEFLPYFAMFICQGPELSQRISAEPEFRQKFLNELWPQFKKLTRKQSLGAVATGPSVAHLMSEPAIWKALEDPEGGQLISELGLVPVVLLYGDQQYPKALHPRVKVLLKSRNKHVIESLLSQELRGNANFLSLVGKQVETRILATAIYQARQSDSPQELDEILRQLASKSEEDLIEELTPLGSPPGLLDDVPQGIYLQVGIRALSGQRIGKRMWEQTARRAVMDTVNLISMYCGAPPGFVEGFEGGYWGTLNAIDRTKDQFLKDTQAKANRLFTDDERERLLRDAESELVHSERFIEAIEMVRDRIMVQRGRQSIDLTPSVLFFAHLTPPQLRSKRIIDWRQVAVHGLPDYRALVSFRKDSQFAARHPEIASFFNDRLALVQKHYDARPGTQTPTTSSAAEGAWKESVSAWWLLAVSGDLPLADWHNEFRIDPSLRSKSGNN